MEKFSWMVIKMNEYISKQSVIDYLEVLRLKYLETKEKQIWYDIIQFLPSSYEQMRTCTMNYENLISIYNSRKAHKLDEWHIFCDFIRGLPYAKELIICEEPSGQ